MTVTTHPSGLIKEYLTNASSSNMAVNGAVTPVSFSYIVPANKRLLVSRLMLFMQSATAMASDDFGDQTALTNGVFVSVGNQLSVTWKDNIDLATTMFDLPGMPNLGKETRTMVGRWTLTKETNGIPIELLPGQAVTAKVSDNLSSLNFFRMTVGGLLRGWGKE